MTQPTIKGLCYAGLAFLAAWQGAEFDLDYRAILGAVVAAGLGYANPAKIKKK